MRTKTHTFERGNGLVVVISVVTVILAILGAAVSYTAHISRMAQRNRRTALAMEIADGHLEFLFTNWRNVYRKTWISGSYSTGGTNYSLLATNDFYTDLYKPSNGCSGCPSPTPAPVWSSSSPTPTPIPTPPIIPLPAKSNFPTEANYNVTQYRIQAVDPMIDLDTSGNALQETTWGSGTYSALGQSAVPPAAFGANTWQYSFFYLAAVDVSVPALGSSSGTVTAKVRRVFEKRFDNPWSYAMFYNDDLEFQPSASFTVNGPIHTNGNLYVGTSNFTSQSNVEYAGAYVNGYSPNDTSTHSGGITTPNFVTNMPPIQVSPYLPFGWNIDLNSSDTNPNNDSYRDIIERPNNSYSDALANVRYYNQPGIRIVINADTTVTATRIDSSGVVTTLNGSAYNTWCANNGQGSSATILLQNQALYDQREGTAVKVTNVDVSKIVSNYSNMAGWTGLVYITDAGAGTSTNVTINGTTYSTTRRAIRLTNGYQLPNGGLTVVSENPVYIQGNYNTSSTSSATIPSNNGTYTDPDASGYTRVPAAVVADAVNVLSPGWSDSASAQAIGSRVASANTTVNAALVAGQVASSGGNYSGGGENFIRFLEDWSTRTFCYYGSMVELYRSTQATGAWNGNGSVYNSPLTSRWYYDDATFSNSSGPPGALQIAAYLQQQRWYQVY
jgi:hypothetical protein